MKKGRPEGRPCIGPDLVARAQWTSAQTFRFTA